MPEGPEIKLHRDQIEPFAVNQTIESITVQSGRYMRHPETWKLPNDILPTKVSSIETHGKLMIWNLENNKHIFITAGMSGLWSIKEEKHNHIKFSFTDNNPLYFNDARNFGTVQFGNPEDKRKRLSKLGPDPLKEEITFDKIKDKINYSKPIGELLLDQSVIGGTGNYLRAEILYACKISPYKLAKDFATENWDILCSETNRIVNLSYQNGGATIRSYKNINGERGRFTERFLCYGRKTDPDGRIVIKETDGTKRSIWFVPEIQKD